MKLLLPLIVIAALIAIIFLSCDKKECPVIDEFKIVGLFAPKDGGVGHLCKERDGMKYCYSVRSLKPKKIK